MIKVSTKYIPQPPVVSSAHMGSSDVYQAKGLHRWAYIQDTTHGTICASTSPEVRIVPGAVGKWTSFLCISLPQVRFVVSVSLLHDLTLGPTQIRCFGLGS